MVKELDISVVIPVYKNCHSLDKLSNRLMTSLSTYEYEIIFVNDGSPDETLSKLEILSLKYSQIRHITLSKNIGQQKATLEGLKVVLGNEIVVMDGDLQDSPELIPALYKAVTSKKNTVFVKRKGIYQSIGRMLSSILFKKIIQSISGLHYRAGSYYIFDRAILSKVILLASKCKYPYMSIIVAHIASQVSYIAADRSKSIGSSGYGFITRTRAAIMAVYCAAYCNYTRLDPD